MPNPPPATHLRPTDLAREHGLSSQAIRNYEDAGILPPAERRPNGYRSYTDQHRRALTAFLALRPGVGHSPATEIMRAVHDGGIDRALVVVAESHAQLLDDRRTLELVNTAVQGVHLSHDHTGEPFIGPLAHRLGLRPATLRKWERAGVLRPRRDPATGYRIYGPDDVRDALLAHQLRRGGHPMSRLATVVDQVRSAGGVDELQALLHEWHGRLAARSRALLRGSAALHAYLDALEPDVLAP